jgi:predicted nucleotidyltransferase
MSKLSFNNINYIETGTHEVSLKTIKNELTFSAKRKSLLFYLEQFLNNYYCKGNLIDSIFILGSFASKKNKPSDIDLAIKLNEKNIDSDLGSNDLFNSKLLKKNLNIQLVFIELENKILEKYIPVSRFFNKQLNDFRSLTFEESGKIDYRKWNPELDLGKKAKGILKISLNNICK